MYWEVAKVEKTGQYSRFLWRSRRPQVEVLGVNYPMSLVGDVVRMVVPRQRQRQQKEMRRNREAEKMTIPR